MTQAELNKLGQLIEQATQARPEIEPAEFMESNWRPFIKHLSLADRRMAWQVYLKSQVKHLHAIVTFVQSLPPEKINALRPALEKFLSIKPIIKNLGSESAKA